MKARGSIARGMGVLFCCGACLMGACVPLTGGTTVEVELDEFTVMATPDAVPAGTVTFRVANMGTEAHEFLVIKTDLAPEGLPTEDNGAYLENGPGTEIIDEIEFIPAGGDGSLTVDLVAGNYVLICNLSNEEIHYALGMHTALAVQ